jgi:hypothetical protein
MTNHKGGPLLLIGLISAGWLIACAGESPGDRAANDGACPSGEVCSPLTPDGLVFVGEALYNDSGVRLGPIAKGGRFDLGVHLADGTALPAVEFQIENPEIVTRTDGTGEFNDGNSSIEVDDYLSLRGVGPGTTYIRVIDPNTGELFDRLAISVTEIGEIRLTNAHNPDNEFQPGVEEALGVELIGTDGTDQRAFDLDMRVTSAATTMGADPGMWDCFLFTLPAESATEEVGFDVTVGDFTQHGTMPVATLETP